MIIDLLPQPHKGISDSGFLCFLGSPLEKYESWYGIFGGRCMWGIIFLWYYYYFLYINAKVMHIERQQLLLLSLRYGGNTLENQQT
jgi:hypothetical protein